MMLVPIISISHEIVFPSNVPKYNEMFCQNPRVEEYIIFRVNCYSFCTFFQYLYEIFYKHNSQSRSSIMFDMCFQSKSSTHLIRKMSILSLHIQYLEGNTKFLDKLIFWIYLSFRLTILLDLNIKIIAQLQ